MSAFSAQEAGMAGQEAGMVDQAAGMVGQAAGMVGREAGTVVLFPKRLSSSDGCAVPEVCWFFPDKGSTWPRH